MEKENPALDGAGEGSLKKTLKLDWNDGEQGQGMSKRHGGHGHKRQQEARDTDHEETTTCATRRALVSH